MTIYHSNKEDRAGFLPPDFLTKFFMGFIIDKHYKTRTKIQSITDTITGLEKAIKLEWAEIKDFVHSYHKTEAATKRIENMKSNIEKLKKERKKLEKKLSNG